MLPAAELARILCDCDIGRAVVNAQGQVLDIGRASRTVPAGLRLALIVRDAGCSYPGCTVPALLTHAHHIVWWSNGGATDLDNLILLCRHHHLQSIHTLGHTITPIAGGFEFRRADGTLVGTTFHATTAQAA